MLRFFGLLSRLFHWFFLFFQSLAFDGTFTAALIGESTGKTERRALLLGLGPKKVKRKSTLVIETTCQADNFVATRLVIPEAIGRHFILLSFRINKTEQLMKGGLPCLLFSELAVGLDLSFEPAMAGQKIEVEVERI